MSMEVAFSDLDRKIVDNLGMELRPTRGAPVKPRLQIQLRQWLMDHRRAAAATDVRRMARARGHVRQLE